MPMRKVGLLQALSQAAAGSAHQSDFRLELPRKSNREIVSSSGFRLHVSPAQPSIVWQPAHD